MYTNEDRKHAHRRQKTCRQNTENTQTVYKCRQKTHRQVILTSFGWTRLEHLRLDRLLGRLRHCDGDRGWGRGEALGQLLLLLGHGFICDGGQGDVLAGLHEELSRADGGG